ncbi:alpha/beta fold hydrolase [Paracoccus thiocyanatus]|uniref:LuxR family transcriptional regulator n=1 Tax=Paracoccus thiocyanatus TaxID=34006 RepID=A0A3D8PD99_9RHOB|nr:alpha/beta fold hydrolase [Paracoccus thiocyanatus]RDW13278.1 LuxR family transcriptional regulator [Paracoccus thiocyanatus]
MSDPKSKTPLADQQFFLSPELSESRDTDHDIDLSIIASTYRSIVDEHAFDEMVANWEAKLASGDDADHPKVSKRLFGQLLTFRDTLEKLDIPAGNDPLKLAVSEVPGPAMVLSPNGNIAVINIAGERAFGGRQGAFMDTAVIAPRSLEDYRALLRAATGQGNAAQAILTILPIAGDFGESFLAEGYLIRLPGQSGAHIAIRSLEIAWGPRIAERLQQAFGLTSAEAEVAQQFFLLRNLDAVAAQRGVSLLTVRTQIKTIMAKMGTPSNIDLMRLLAMIASREHVGLRGEAPVWHDPLGREKLIAMPDGRKIAWTWMGARRGVPVVMLRGLPMTYLLPGDGEARLRDAGICLYVPSRPGHGNSTMDPSLDVMGDNLVALRAFLDQVVGRRPCLGVGVASGTLPLVVEAVANPARFHGILAVGYSCGIDPSGIQRLPRIQRTMLQLAGSAPWVAELMAKSGHRMMRQHGLDWYLERAFRHMPLNQQIVRNPDWTALIRNACEHLLKQGHATFVRELQLSRYRMDAALRDLAIPMRYLAPAEDPGIDVASCKQLERLNPMIAVELVSDATDLIFYQRSELILDHIIASARRN